MLSETTQSIYVKVNIKKLAIRNEIKIMSSRTKKAGKEKSMRS